MNRTSRSCLEKWLKSKRGAKRLILRMPLRRLGYWLAVVNSLHDFSSLDATRTYEHALGRAVGEKDLDTLQIGKEPAAVDTGNLFTNPAGLFSQSAP